MVSGPVFQAGGLASGLDTNAIVDALVGIEEVRVGRLEQKKLDYTTQLTVMTDVIVKSQDLRRSLEALKEAGVTRKVTSTHTQFSPTISSAAQDGEYQIQVTQLAQAAKARSGTFTGAGDVIMEGSITLNVKGVAFDVAINDGDTLADVAGAINDSNAGVTASVLFDGTNYILAVNADSTGYEIGDVPGSALSITENYTGATGAQLGLAITQTAQNANFTVDGLAFERQSNTVADAITGVELSLSQTGTATETLIIGRDSEAMIEQVQSLIDNYNTLQTLLRSQTRVTPGTDTSAMLTRDPAVKAYAREIDNLMAMTSTGSGKISTLTSLGVDRDRNGMLTFDKVKFKTALDQNPKDVEKFFAGDEGFAAQASTLVNRYASVAGGSLYRRQDDITTSMSDLTDEQLKIKSSVEKFRERLIRQFAAMEQVVGRYNAIGDFLAQQDARATKR